MLPGGKIVVTSINPSTKQQLGRLVSQSHAAAFICSHRPTRFAGCCASLAGAPCGRVDGGRHWHPLHPSAQLVQWGRPGASRPLATTERTIATAGPFPVRPSCRPQPPTSPSSLLCLHWLDTSRAWPARVHLWPGWKCSDLAPLAHRVRPGPERPHDGSRIYRKLGGEEECLCSLRFAAPRPSRDFT